MTRKSPARPDSLALALGAGGARGLAHIVLLETLDELGLRPAALSGASIGALVGAAHAAGHSGRDLRAHVLGLTRDRAAVMARLLQCRVGRLSDLLGGFGNPVLIDAEAFVETFWPGRPPATFADLAAPLEVAVTDYYGRRGLRVASGALTPALAASMAIPGLLRPVGANGRVLVDGGAADPLPYEGLEAGGRIVLACDVTGGPAADGAAIPGAFEALLGASQIMQAALVAEKLRRLRPAVLVTPAVGGFRALDFFSAPRIFRAAEAMRDGLKRDLERALGGREPAPG